MAIFYGESPGTTIPHNHGYLAISKPAQANSTEELQKACPYRNLHHRISYPSVVLRCGGCFAAGGKL